VTTASSLLVYFTPDLPWSSHISQPAAAAAALALCGLCWLLPFTSASAAALALLGCAFAVSRYFGLGVGGIFASLYFLPQASLFLDRASA